MAEVKVAKNRVQPANLLQAKCFVSWVTTGANWWQSPFFAFFRSLYNFCHGLLAAKVAIYQRLGVDSQLASE